jgi:pimeloyl-ACP methyl ester carboxylesterase
VGCSQGGKIAIDAALSYPEKIHAMVLIAPSVGGAPQAEYPPGIERLMSGQKEAEDAGDIDRVNAIKAHLWLDGPLAREGRVSGPARDLFLEMNGIALRAPATGPVLDTAHVFHRLSELSAHTLVIGGEQDFPHILERCRYIVAAIANAVGVELKEAAHLPSLDSPEEIIRLIDDFLRSY